jgi:hypothetical protein
MSGIIRVVKDGNFSVVSNIPLNDSRLSWEARGVMAYLLTKPDTWIVRREDLIKQGPAGEAKIRKVLKELRDCGYLVRELVRRDDGKISYVSTIYESPNVQGNSSRDENSTAGGLSTSGSTACGKSHQLTKTNLIMTDEPIFNPADTENDCSNRTPTANLTSNSFSKKTFEKPSEALKLGNRFEGFPDWCRSFPWEGYPNKKQFSEIIELRGELQLKRFIESLGRDLKVAHWKHALNAAYRYFVTENQVWDFNLEKAIQSKPALKTGHPITER